MAEFNAIRVTNTQNVRIISLNRPASLNAFNADMRRELTEATAAANADDSVKVVILTGEGRAFCAGADLAEEDGKNKSVEDRLNNEYKPAILNIHTAPKPYIAAVNGAAAGIGSAYAMACDLVVMGKSGFIYQAFSAIGLVPDGGATWHLTRQLGPKRAYEIMVLGEKVKAQQCFELGLINRIVEDEDLQSEALELANTLAGRAPLSLRHTKQLLRQTPNQSLDQAIATEAAVQEKLAKSADFAEGRTAFLEKRGPVWTGK